MRLKYVNATWMGISTAHAGNRVVFHEEQYNADGVCA